VISRASVDDWPELWPIWSEVVSAVDTYVYDPASSFEQSRDKWFGSPTSEVWMYRDAAGAALGMYWMGPNHSGPGSHIANASYMVAAPARGQGVGRQLVEHSLVRAAERGFRGIQFNAVVETNENAILLYQHLGFAVVGRIPGGFRHPEDGYVDLLIMFRPLP
jgi:ribosomal protein S18 acetylase RimI-like enzyme